MRTLVLEQNNFGENNNSSTNLVSEDVLFDYDAQIEYIRKTQPHKVPYLIDSSNETRMIKLNNFPILIKIQKNIRNN